MTRRDRHGRGLRTPMLPREVPAYRARSQQFDEAVARVADRLEKRWGYLWGRVEFAVEEIPPSDPNHWEEGVALGRLFPADLGQSARIVLYRQPIVQRTENFADTEDLLREIIVEHVSHLIGKSPEEVDPE